jgi:hypothetical protein
MTPNLPMPDANHEFLVPVPGAGGPAPSGGRLDELARDRLMQVFGFEAEPGALRFGTCPACNRKSLTALGAMPLSVYCARTAKCGWEEQTIHLVPELFAEFCARFPSTPEDPAATATAYLRYVRGFDAGQIAGFYTQGTYWNPRGDRGTATVRFEMAEGLAWEHLIDPVILDRGSPRETVVAEAVTGELDGRWWQVPGQDLSQANEVWIVTRIFDAIALHLHGVRAVAILASTNYPAEALIGLAAQCMGKGRPDLVWALDGDLEGRKHTRKWVERARAEGWPCKAAAIPQKGRAPHSWNDLHLRDKLTSSHLDDYRYHGALQIAPSARDKALLIYHRKEWHEFSLDFDNRLYWFKLDLEKYGKEAERVGRDKPELDEDKAREEALKASSTVSEIANCRPVALYYQANAVTDESWYYFRIEFPHDGAPVKNTFTGGQLSANGEFKKRLLCIAPGAVWTGTQKHLDRLLTQLTYHSKVVQTVDYIGYAKDHRAWIFNDIAIQDGRVYRLNEEDFFELKRLSIKSQSRSVELDLNTDLSRFQTEWLSALWTCFGPRGLVVLTFWFLSLFAEQVYERLKFFPFLELIGEGGSGKTTLIEFLWKLVGRHDWEGFDPTNASQSALARNFNQVSNLPVVLIEGDRTADQATGRPAKCFNWDEVKKLYNRRGFRARGVKNRGNDTYDPPFRGTLVVMQNHPIQADRPVLERFIEVPFDKRNHNEVSRNAARKLETMKLEALSGFLVKACCAAREVLDVVFDRLPVHEKSLEREQTIKTHRIVMHHALMMASVEALAKVLPISEEQVAETRGELLELAMARQRAISSDHPLLEAFWEFFHDIEGDHDGSPGNRILNHSNSYDEIAINLTDYAEYIGKRGLQQQAPAIGDLRRLFPNTTTHKYLGNKTVNSAIHKRSTRCWVFKR